MVRGKSGRGPVALSTRLGYVVRGPLSTEQMTVASPTLVQHIHITKFCDHETLGTKDGEFD